jgi:hypothetical protein
MAKNEVFKNCKECEKLQMNNTSITNRMICPDHECFLKHLAAAFKPKDDVNEVPK